ncbi:hypothetical protein J3T78_14055 [Staphylococcus nepalensis]|uniref:Glycosyltransferase n=1 Tax=Staphylococcus nepalensis TaxID=214473 RepID=A0ABS3KZL5_9STAP|nr:ATP-grasp fold amidoligase family protein [Staphylococcus nepalensis]MBO1214458.1 hypothetical protein [Staphylococcus nepalensis]MBO1216246.1 hypothetical protein [Staphylococcus nepalensis]MBO1226747.1 hypothetical protein [Staphylococcus nepalensis]MBO1233393.1 hypothetical protein [Staphylococcus nepalensis]MBO1238789.1 hypothetical protein [Staphylococcus nepalensis]
MITKIKLMLRKIFLRNSTKEFYKKLRCLKIYLMSKLKDETYVKFNVRLNTGIKLNLNNPKMHIEKINWLKLNYRNPLQTEYTDKYKMRKHLINKGYSNILPSLIGVYKSFDEINFDQLPNKVFLKTNHTSGINQAIISGKTNMSKVKEKFEKALVKNYYDISREWNYKNIEPRIIVEPFLDMDKYVDYKFFVFNGKVEFFAIIKGINDDNGNQSLDSQFNLYDVNLNPLQVGVKRKSFDDKHFNFSNNIDEMIVISEDLANPFPFCRVDFLVCNQEYFFGEMTFHPNGGEMVLHPMYNEYYYGDKIKLENISDGFIKRK